MSFNPHIMKIRAKKIGVLIRNARLAVRKTIPECAQAIGVSEQTFEAYEMGEQAPSLPELEGLAYLFKIPVEHFWGDQTLSDDDGKEKLELARVVRLRQRVIGGLLRKARQQANLSLEAVAERLNLSPEVLESYEMGEKAIPLPELELLSSILDISFREFQDRHSPVGQWSVQQQAIQEFLELAPELQKFVCLPVNRPYLEVARRLSEMSVDKLRAVAEGLLEITL